MENKNFYKLDSKVLSFKIDKESDKILFNHYIMKKENLARLKRDSESGEFEISVRNISTDLGISTRQAQNLIDEFIRLNIIRLVKSGFQNKGGSIYKYICINETVVNTDIAMKNELNISQKIIQKLNLASKKNFKHTTTKTKNLIRARINEGFTEEDFYKVIDIKCSNWLGTRMEMYLRPETLFSNKFESYLNESKINTRTDKYEYATNEGEGSWDPEGELK